ncbi:L-lactate permease [Hyphomicrobium facile]|uniref:L-lactate permease n=1 Tax=Hyphomicrobium facile TaxID=51670 RepID=A0A1I7NPY1_9HYPH|nr:L-lactate permease [Hyphomicrobium facile]SFV36747.1 lactate permease [Hyphomicrobium facile]
MWSQIYDPFANMPLSAVVAIIPVVVLLGGIGLFELRAHMAALLGLGAALLVAIVAYGMPAKMAGMAAVYGAAFGLLPIGWIILNVIFLYRLASEKGEFDVLQKSIGAISDDRRLQLLFVAFSFGAFFEGAAGFGTPVAVTAAMLIGLGFPPLAASGLSLIANTAPVAFGALGTPLVALAAVTGLDLYELSATVGRQLAPFAVIVPFWLIWAFVGFRKMIEVWPPILVAGLSFAIPQYLVSNFHGPWLVNVVASLVSMAALALFLRVWSPAVPMTKLPNAPVSEKPLAPVAVSHSLAVIRRAWTPWIILAVFVFLWGTPQVRAALDGLWVQKIPVMGLHELVQKMPPVVQSPHAEAAIFNVNILSATGTGILISAIISGVFLGYSLGQLARMYAKTIYVVRYSLLTISCMMAIGFITRYSGSDATLGLMLAHTGWAYPFFGTLIGWLGVALTGSDTSSNVLFGGLQRITAEQLGINPVLMAAANSAGGVMGKMIDAQSIVVASTATKWYGHEGSILRFVFFHSLALATLVGLLVMAQVYLWPFTLLAP